MCKATFKSKPFKWCKNSALKGVCFLFPLDGLESKKHKQLKLGLLITEHRLTKHWLTKNMRVKYYWVITFCIVSRSFFNRITSHQTFIVENRWFQIHFQIQDTNVQTKQTSHQLTVKNNNVVSDLYKKKHRTQSLISSYGGQQAAEQTPEWRNKTTLAPSHWGSGGTTTHQHVYGAGLTAQGYRTELNTTQRGSLHC